MSQVDITNVCCRINWENILSLCSPQTLFHFWVLAYENMSSLQHSFGLALEMQFGFLIPKKLFLLSKVEESQPIRLDLARLRSSDGQWADCGWSVDVPPAAETIQY